MGGPGPWPHTRYRLNRCLPDDVHPTKAVISLTRGRRAAGLVVAPVKAGFHLVSAGHGVRAARVGPRSPAMGSSRRAATPRAAVWPR
jgi:hypothetical protein